jgi:hypothetical protein
MLKLISAAIACTFAAFPVFAQSQAGSSPSYYQNAQQAINQSNIQAQKQFNKTYPKPTVPVIQAAPPAGTNTNVVPAAPPSLSTKNNAAGNTPDNTNNNNNNGYNYSYASPNNKNATVPPSDITVNPGNKNNTAAMNIYAPPGTANSNSNAAPNPYG